MKQDRSSQSEGGQRQRAEAIFHGALQLPPEHRADYLKQACAGEEQLRKEVEDLLTADEEAGDFLETPQAASPNPTIVLTMPVTERPGDRIGRYKLLQQIGEGGCGVVYMAEQEEPVRRRVALKVIKLGMDTRQVVARFEAERQALALMDHPNIAKVLDAGATETGRPFFVMELVRGIKITEYCDQNRLSAEERLKLFVQLCHALQHAHQKGIIHRDIKPSNILVTVNDGVPVPKVIDFGIAKATEQRLTEKTLFTAFEQFIGTPAYMSPEQAVMTSLDIDTRTDIYSLGVLLYELLTGQTPFDAKDLLASGLDALRKTIREQEPERPSTRLKTMVHAELSEIASHYRTEAPRLIHLLRGDLDWIVMKALEKDRTRRYETANGLAMDIERYLTSEPVLARPPSTLYRCQKLIRRNKVAFAAIGTGVAALIVGLAVSLYLFFQERHALQRAIAAEKEAKKTAELQTQIRVTSERSQEVGMAAFLLTQGKYEEAEKAIRKVPVRGLPYIITNFPATAAILNSLAEKHARHGEWLRAITNCSPVADSFPFDRIVFQQIAPLLAKVSASDRYQHYCELILQHYAGNAEAVVATTVGKNCLLLPLPRADVEIARDMAESALANKPANDAVPDLLFMRGFANYRLGDYPKAAEALEKAVAADGTRYHNIESLLALAMAQFQLKDVDTARKTLAKGADYAARKLPKPGNDEFSDHWNEVLPVDVLLREARTLIGEPVASGESVSGSQP